MDKQYADYPCVNLLDSTSVTVEPTGQGSFAVCRAVRVQTTVGALQQRVLKYDYDPLTAAATFKRVTIYHADGTYTSVDVSKACDYAAPARAIYWGARQIMLELGALQPGDIIDYEIDKKGFTYALLGDAPQTGDDSRFIPPMRGQFYDIVPFWSDDPTLRKVYRVSLPAEKKCNSSSIRAAALPPCATKTDGKSIPSPKMPSFPSVGNRIWSISMMPHRN